MGNEQDFTQNIRENQVLTGGNPEIDMVCMHTSRNTS